MFVIFYTVNVYICVFMICSISYCLYDTWIHGMYVTTYSLCSILCLYDCKSLINVSNSINFLSHVLLPDEIRCLQMMNLGVYGKVLCHKHSVVRVHIIKIYRE